MLRRSAAELEGVLVGAVALVALLLMDAYVRDSPEPANDELVYELMAREPFDPHTFPFAYRVAVPTLVNVLPFSHETSFSALAWLFTAACGTLAYVLLRRFEIGKPLAAGISFSLALCPTLFVVSLRQGYNVDPESLFVMLAGAIAIKDRRPLALDWGRIILLAAPVVIVAAAWTLRDRPRLAAVTVGAFLAMNVGYAIYMEDFDGAQEGIIEVEPSPYEIR